VVKASWLEKEELFLKKDELEWSILEKFGWVVNVVFDG
jgi:G:T-mismatch repair DNA endonuclease (very short patch repair protein)